MIALLLMAASCSPATPPADSDGTWVGTITTEGNLTTVVNESGSIWGGTARLVEEASIGVDAGAEEYMLARVASVAASDDRIYVLEQRPPVLRVYTWEGVHVLNIGREGQGPGEFRSPASVALAPDGRIFVRDEGNARFGIFDQDGQLVDTWPEDGSGSTRGETVIAPDGTPYSPFPVLVNAASRQRVIGFVPYGREGALGEPLMPPDSEYEQARLSSGSRFGPVPFSPRPVTVLSPQGAMVFGIGDEYAIEVRNFDGNVRRIIRRTPPVPIGEEERASRTRAETAYWREQDPSWSWNGPDVPDRKPYFDDLYADADGRIWVSRSGPSRRVPECNEDPPPGQPYVSCWEPTTFTEVFDNDGRFLGEVPFPRYYGFQSNFMRGDTLIKQVQDEAGTIMVKRYRLVLPGGR